MIDLVEQAGEAATRSQKLATADRAIDDSRSGDLHPAVASALDTKAPAKAGAAPGTTKDTGTTDPKDVAKTAKDGEPARDASRDAALDQMSSPARKIVSALRVQKNTGAVKACEDEHEHLDVWHLIGHIGRAAKQVGSYGLHGASASIGVPSTEPKGFLAGVSAGIRDAKRSPKDEIVDAAIANAAKPSASEGKRSAGKPRNAGGMEL